MGFLGTSTVIDSKRDIPPARSLSLVNLKEVLIFSRAQRVKPRYFRDLRAKRSTPAVPKPGPQIDRNREIFLEWN